MSDIYLAALAGRLGSHLYDIAARGSTAMLDDPRFPLSGIEKAVLEGKRDAEAHA